LASGTTQIIAASGGGAGPRSRYHVTEGSGTTTADSGSRAAAMTFTGGVTWVAAIDGHSTYALANDGTGTLEATDVGLPTGNSAFSVSFWFKTSGNSGLGTNWNSLFKYGNQTGNQGTRILENKDNGQLTYGSYAQNASSNATGLNDGNAHHVALVYDGATQTLYIDNTFDSSASGITNALTSSGTMAFLCAAGIEQTGQNTGDDLQIYSYALSPSQIATIYAGGQIGAATPLNINGSTNGVSLGTNLRSLVLAGSGSGDGGWMVLAQAT
jgi:hypothetical protein